MYSVKDTLKRVGFPIRRSSDQRLFTPSRSLSQCITSFIASVRQGIRYVPLLRLNEKTLLISRTVVKLLNLNIVDKTLSALRYN